jgi:hypothetical protein
MFYCVSAEYFVIESADEQNLQLYDINTLSPNGSVEPAISIKYPRSQSSCGWKTSL